MCCIFSCDAEIILISCDLSRTIHGAKQAKMKKNIWLIMSSRLLADLTICNQLEKKLKVKDIQPNPLKKWGGGCNVHSEYSVKR